MNYGVFNSASIYEEEVTLPKATAVVPGYESTSLSQVVPNKHYQVSLVIDVVYTNDSIRVGMPSSSLPLEPLRPGATHGLSSTQQPSLATPSVLATADNHDMDQAGTPDVYAATVIAYSHQPEERFLDCGSHFRYLAQFLEPPVLQETPQYSKAPHFFLFLTQLRLNKNRQTLQYDGTTGLPDFSANPSPEANEAQLLFMRGFPSPEWLKRLGSRLRIDPEFFRRHLNFLRSKDHFDLPALPHTSRSMFHLQIVTICTRQTPISLPEVQKSRQEEVELVRKHQRQMCDVGDSIVRRYSVHNETTFTIEQNISCFVGRSGDHWVALAWLDTGRPLDLGPLAMGTMHTNVSYFFPVIQHRPKAALFANGDSAQHQVRPDPTSNKNCQSATHLPSQYGSFLNEAVMCVDVMYALSGLFTFMECSENQFINFMHNHIDEALRVAETQEELSLATLRYSERLLADHVEHIAETVDFLKSGGDPKWPRVTEGRNARIANEVHQQLLEGFATLLDRARTLVEKCSRGTEIIVNGAQLQESRNAIAQAGKIEKLTLLAFFFVPLSFTSGVFGMNLSQFGQGDLSIWIYFVIAAPVLLLSATVLFWDRITTWWMRRQT